MTVGSTISHYQITGKLGSGGMGVVYKAEDTKLHRTVALKFLPAELSCDEEAKQRFMLEAQAASSLQHNNICTIHEIEETGEGQIFICMDCYEGDTLDKAMRGRHFEIDEALDIILQAAYGLEKAHHKGIVHRDIKPSNIFLTEDKVVKILDFGLAKLSGSSIVNTKLGTTIGTIAYMSPEQARGDKVDERTDIWSLGVVFYQMLSGQLPFRGDYDQAVIYSILNQEPEALNKMTDNVPLGVQAFVEKCLSKDPAERFKNMDEVIAGLKELKHGGTYTEVSKAIKPKVNNKILLLSAAALILALAIIFYFIRNKTASADIVSIAVLPFHPITASEEDKGFAEGIHDDILTQLSKIRGMQVIARTSVMQYQNTDKPVRQIASELGVGVVLEGSTRRSGDKIRVTATLIDAETEKNLWADSYDRQYGDIFSIQSDIAQKIASALEVSLGSEEKRSIETQDTKNLAAYEYFQKGKFYWNSSFDYAGNLKAAEMFEEACKLDTTFTLAYAYQSMAYTTVLTDLPATMKKQKNIIIAKNERALNKAMELAPSRHEVLMAKGNYLFLYKDDKKAAIEELEKADKARPNNIDVLYLMSMLYSIIGDAENSLRIDKKIYALNPKWSPGISSLAWDNFYLHRYKESARWADVFISADPESGEGYGIKFRALALGLGDLKSGEGVLKEGERYIRTFPYYITVMKFYNYLYRRDYLNALAVLNNWEYRERFILRTIALRALNRFDEARVNFDSARVSFAKEELNHNERSRVPLSVAIAFAGSGEKEKALRELGRIDSSFQGRYHIDRAYTYILLGENKQAIECLKRSLDNPYDMGLAMLMLDPRLDPVKNDPEFMKLSAKAGAVLKMQ
ncbi:MAG: protein kinase [Ignavibacteria bacterium]|jgi:non-specific serine/threonine protein kinase|nr:protein kinase [Ignavibacteria bacterium]